MMTAEVSTWYIKILGIPLCFLGPVHMISRQYQVTATSAGLAVDKALEQFSTVGDVSCITVQPTSKSDSIKVIT